MNQLNLAPPFRRPAFRAVGWAFAFFLHTVFAGNTPPQVTCPANIVTNAAPGSCSQLVAFDATATGTPPPKVTFLLGSNVITSPHAFPVGTNQVDVIASNGVPPDATCSFTVTVNDTEAPRSCVTPPPGMLSWWPAEGGANDIQGSNHGTLVNGATLAAGFVGSAFRFDGVDDRVDVPASASLNVTGDQLTLDGWINPATNVSGTIYFGRSQSSDHPYLIFFATGGIRIVIRVGNNQEHNTGYVPATNEWTHIALVYDGTAMRFYANGVEVFSAPQSGTLDSSSLPFCIGNRTIDALTSFHGLIDEVEVFNRALSAEELRGIFRAGSFGKCPPIVTTNTPGQCAAVVNFTVPAADNCSSATVVSTPASGSAFPTGVSTVTNIVTDASGNAMTNAFAVRVRDTEAPRTCITPPANMMGWWPGDGNFNDIQSGNTGTSMNGANFASGNVGQAFNFNGVNQFVSAGDPANLRLTGNQVTIDGWVRPTSFAGTDVYFGKTQNANNDYLLIYQFDQLTGMIKAGGTETIIAAPTPFVPPLNQWTHVALTYDGSAMRLYANGVLLSSTPKTGNLAGTGAPFCIGGRPGGLFFAGQIDEVEVFNRALSSNEIRAVFEAGSFGKCKPVVATNDAGQCSAVVSFTKPVSDNCSGASIACTPASGSIFPVGTTTVTNTATDSAGNFARSTFTVTVLDSTPPGIAAPPNVLAFTGAGASNCTAFVNDATLGSATASDNCAVASNTRSNVPPGNLFTVGTNLVLYRATDPSGHSSVATQRVVVADNTPPVLNCPSEITVTASGACPAIVHFVLAATDNCSLASVVANPPSGSSFALGSNTVRVTAIDAAGNSNTCSFIINVVPGAPPWLRILRSGTNVVLSWPSEFACYTLQSTPALAIPPATNVWMNYAGPIITNGGSLSVTDRASGSNRFYRLQFQ